MDGVAINGTKGDRPMNASTNGTQGDDGGMASGSVMLSGDVLDCVDIGDPAEVEIASVVAGMAGESANVYCEPEDRAVHVGTMVALAIKAYRSEMDADR